MSNCINCQKCGKPKEADKNAYCEECRKEEGDSLIKSFGLKNTDRKLHPFYTDTDPELREK